jgi:hypothetical protein
MGRETADGLRRQMDAAGVNRVTLLSEFPANFRGPCPPMKREEMHAAAQHVAELQRADPERICGLFWADPCSESILEEVE